MPGCDIYVEVQLRVLQAMMTSLLDCGGCLMTSTNDCAVAAGVVGVRPAGARRVLAVGMSRCFVVTYSNWLLACLYWSPLNRQKILDPKRKNILIKILSFSSLSLSDCIYLSVLSSDEFLYGFTSIFCCKFFGI